MDAKNIKLTLLNLPGWGSVSASKIFMEYSAENLTDPDSMLDAIKELASKQKRIKIPSISEIQQAFLQAESIQNNCLKANIQILTEEEANYPIRLKNQDKKPLVLYAKGNSTMTKFLH